MVDNLIDFKAVTFRIGRENFGLHINQVLSIERIEEVTNVPQTPEYMIGIINLRGTITPVIDLGKLLHDRNTQATEETRIIIVNIEDTPIGLVVDAATDVIDIPYQSIQSPNFVNVDDISFLHGVAKLQEKLLVLIDINKLLTNITEIHNIREIIQSEIREGF